MERGGFSLLGSPHQRRDIVGSTMVGAILTDVFVLGNPIMVIAPGGLLAAVVIAAFRDPQLDSTIATLEQRKRRTLAR